MTLAQTLSPTAPATAVSRVDGPAAWIVVAAAGAATAAVLGVFGSIGVLIDPLAGDRGIPRTQLVPLFGLALLVHSVAAPLVGRVADRAGARPLLATSAVALAAGLVTLALARHPAIMLAGYGLGLGVASASVWVATSAAVSSWFEHRRPLALGVLSASAGVGGMLIAPATAALAATYGPRTACLVLAAVGTALCGAGALVVRRRPDVAAPPPRHQVARPTRPDGGGAAPSTGLRRFYAAAGLSSLVAFLPVVYVAGHAVDVGLSPTQGAAVLSLIGAISATARVVLGFLGTRISVFVLYRACHLIMGVAFAVWALTDTAAARPTLIAFAVLFGLGYGGWLSLGPALLATVCPAARLGRALGLLATAGGLGGFLGPLLASPFLAAARSSTLVASGALMVLAAVVLGRGRATGRVPGRVTGPART